EIWISKAGSCRIEILTLINDKLPDAESLDPSIMSAIANLASDCPVWKHTGLDLRTNHASHAQPRQGHAHASYFLRHPDLSSEMIAHPNIPSAQFQGLRCEANYSFKSSKKGNRIRTGTPKPPITEPLNSSQDMESTSQNHTYSLRSNPKRSKKAAVAAQEEVGNTNPPSTSESPFPDYQQEDIESLVAEAIADMACVLDFAFRKLIGVRGISPGMRTIKNLASPSLTEIAPAVWDLQYLQTMSVHAQIIPSIATGIARLKNARSASLREKLNNLTHQTTLGIDGQEFADSEADATDEIQPEPIKRPFATKQGGENTGTKARPQQLNYAGQELEIPTVCVDEDGNGTRVAMESYGLEPDYDPYVVFPGAPFETGHLEIDTLLQMDESYMSSDQVSPSDDWTHSSEGDYFYTDGQGNVYPIEKQENSEGDHSIDWPSASQLVDSDGYSQQHDEDLEELWDQAANQAYIMSYEDGFPVSGVHTRPNDAINQPFLPPYPDDTPHDNWAWE
ncbi:uncharacterized protein B0H64DRAFT_457970, partial [Chaetomium fimeti]